MWGMCFFLVVDSEAGIFLFLTESEGTGASRKSGLPGSLSDLPVSWDQRIPHC